MSASNHPVLKHVASLTVNFEDVIGGRPTPRGTRSWAQAKGGKLTDPNGEFIASVLPAAGDYMYRLDRELIVVVDMHTIAQGEDNDLFHFRHDGFTSINEEMMKGMGSPGVEDILTDLKPKIGWTGGLGGLEAITVNTSSSTYRWMNFAVLVGEANLLLGPRGVSGVDYRIFQIMNRNTLGPDIMEPLTLEYVANLELLTQKPDPAGGPLHKAMWVEITGGILSETNGTKIADITTGGGDFLTRHLEDSVLELDIHAVGKHECGTIIRFQNTGFLNPGPELMRMSDPNTPETAAFVIPSSLLEFGSCNGFKRIKCTTSSAEYWWLNFAILFGQARFVTNGEGVVAMEFRVYRVRN